MHAATLQQSIKYQFLEINKIRLSTKNNEWLGIRMSLGRFD